MSKIHRFSIDPDKPKEALEELDRFQNRVRKLINDKRTHLEKVEKTSVPTNGELLFDGGNLFLVVNGKYRRLLFADEPKEAVPDWFLTWLSDQEALMKSLGFTKAEMSKIGGV